MELTSGAVDPAFWRGRRVLLTGHTGFKGSWLSLWLQGMGARVTGYALAPPTTPSLFEAAGVARNMAASIAGDIRNANSLTAAMRAAQPEVVIHMAAQPLVRLSYHDPILTYSTNVMGTVNVLEAVRSTPSVRAVINVTTDKCYENREWIWGYREGDPMGGHDPYSNSKACAEFVTAAYRASFFGSAHSGEPVALASARAGNVIGGGDWAADRLIPDILAAFEQGRPARIRNPKSLRPWQHVLEPLRGYLMLAEKLVLDGRSYAEGWNFGPNDEDTKPVGWIVQQLATRCGDGASWQFDDGPHPHEATLLKLDTSKARGCLRWQPVLGLPKALDMIVDWHRQHRDGADMRKVTLQQIADYQTRTAAVSEG